MKLIKKTPLKKEEKFLKKLKTKITSEWGNLYFYPYFKDILCPKIKLRKCYTEFHLQIYDEVPIGNKKIKINSNFDDYLYANYSRYGNEIFPLVININESMKTLTFFNYKYFIKDLSNKKEIEIKVGFLLKKALSKYKDILSNFKLINQQFAPDSVKKLFSYI